MTASFGIVSIFALFQTSDTNPSFRDTLKISVIVGANSAAYVFQNHCARSSGPDGRSSGRPMAAAAAAATFLQINH